MKLAQLKNPYQQARLWTARISGVLSFVKSCITVTFSVKERDFRKLVSSKEKKIYVKIWYDLRTAVASVAPCLAYKHESGISPQTCRICQTICFPTSLPVVPKVSFAHSSNNSSFPVQPQVLLNITVECLGDLAQSCFCISVIILKRDVDSTVTLCTYGNYLVLKCM